MAVAATCSGCNALVTPEETYCRQCGVTLKSALPETAPAAEEARAGTSEESIAGDSQAEPATPAAAPENGPLTEKEAAGALNEHRIELPPRGEDTTPAEHESQSEASRAGEEKAAHGQNARRAQAQREKAGKALLNREYKLQGRKYALVLQKIKLLMDSKYRLYGLFGRPSTGKSCLIYALRQHFKKGSSQFGGFTPEGESWDHLAEDLEKQWRTGRPTSTARDEIHVYQATNPRGKKHFALLDVAGEHFEDTKSWSGEIFDFFGTYLANCKGFFILVELDDTAVGHAEFGKEGKSQQLKNIVSFLSVAATIGRIKNPADLEHNRDLLEQSRKNVGRRKVRVPVVVCLSKADRVSSMDFGQEIGRIRPGKEGDPLGNPWNVVKTFWPAHYRSLLNLVPHLKIEWLSCLGPEFETTRRFSGSLGLHSAIEHVILQPPPAWAMSTQHYQRLRKWLRIPN